MNYIIYISTSTKLFSDADLKEMLLQSRINNNNANITGMLLYSKGTFFQILEGEEQQVNSTFEKIKTDPRHKGVLRMKSGTTTDRNFNEWFMGFTTVVPDSLSQVPGFIDPSKKEFWNYCTNSTHPAVNLLKSFVLSNNFSF